MKFAEEKMTDLIEPTDPKLDFLGSKTLISVFLDCFYRKHDKTYALLDYEQAHEIDPNDDSIKRRMAKIYHELGVDKYDAKKYTVGV